MKNHVPHFLWCTAFQLCYTGKQIGTSLKSRVFRSQQGELSFLALASSPVFQQSARSLVLVTPEIQRALLHSRLEHFSYFSDHTLKVRNMHHLDGQKMVCADNESRLTRRWIVIGASSSIATSAKKGGTNNVLNIQGARRCLSIS